MAMNILNNGRFGMVAALSGTMKGLIMRAVSSPLAQNVCHLAMCLLLCVPFSMCVLWYVWAPLACVCPLVCVGPFGVCVSFAMCGPLWRVLWYVFPFPCVSFAMCGPLWRVCVLWYVWAPLACVCPLLCVGPFGVSFGMCSLFHVCPLLCVGPFGVCVSFGMCGPLWRVCVLWYVWAPLACVCPLVCVGPFGVCALGICAVWHVCP